MIFRGQSVVLDLGSNLPFKTKKQLKDIVERNGGKIAYSLNKWVSLPSSLLFKLHLFIRRRNRFFVKESKKKKRKKKRKEKIFFGMNFHPQLRASKSPLVQLQSFQIEEKISEDLFLLSFRGTCSSQSVKRGSEGRTLSNGFQREIDIAL